MVEVCWRAVKVIKGEWGAEGVVAGNVRRRKHAVNENRSRWVEVSKTVKESYINYFKSEPHERKRAVNENKSRWVEISNTVGDLTNRGILGSLKGNHINLGRGKQYPALRFKSRHNTYANGLRLPYL